MAGAGDILIWRNFVVKQRFNFHVFCGIIGNKQSVNQMAKETDVKLLRDGVRSGFLMYNYCVERVRRLITTVFV